VGGRWRSRFTERRHRESIAPYSRATFTSDPPDSALSVARDSRAALAAFALYEQIVRRDLVLDQVPSSKHEAFGSGSRITGTLVVAFPLAPGGVVPAGADGRLHGADSPGAIALRHGLRPSFSCQVLIQWNGLVARRGPPSSRSARPSPALAAAARGQNRGQHATRNGGAHQLECVRRFHARRACHERPAAVRNRPTPRRAPMVAATPVMPSSGPP
jgi:hypothetical protein